jgi:hypothetical protein
MSEGCEASRVLVLNHHGLGEVLMSLPVCRWLVAERGEDVWMTIVGLEEQICTNQRCGNNFVPFTVSKTNPFNIVKLVFSLRKLHINSVVALYGFEPKMVEKFSLLIGAKEWFCHPVDEKDMFDRNTIHKRYRHLNIVENFLNKTFPYGQENDYLLDDISLFSNNPLADIGIYIVLVPGSGERERFKRWPVEQFISFSKLFIKKFPKIKIVITGTSAESELAEIIAKKTCESQVINLCGKLNLRQLAGVFHQSIMVLGGDCGGLHLAKAAGSRVVAIMGPTNSALTGPIEADLIIDMQLPGTPWYCRKALNKKAYCIEEPSMQIPASDVLESIVAHGFFD